MWRAIRNRLASALFRIPMNADGTLRPLRRVWIAAPGTPHVEKLASIARIAHADGVTTWRLVFHDDGASAETGGPDMPEAQIGDVVNVVLPKSQ